MPEVFCNTSPLQYLHQLGLLHLLREFYGRVTVPEAVAREVDAGLALGVTLPDVKTIEWITVRDVPSPPLFPPGDLDRGEWEVLALAAQTPGSLVVIDDGLARRYARLHRIKFTGTLGVLLKAKQRGRILALQPIVAELEKLGFHLDAATRQAVTKLAGESP